MRRNKHRSTRGMINCQNDLMMIAEGLRNPLMHANKKVLIKSPEEKELLKEVKKEQNPNFKGVVLVPFNNIG